MTEAKGQTTWASGRTDDASGHNRDTRTNPEPMITDANVILRTGLNDGLGDLLNSSDSTNRRRAPYVFLPTVGLHTQPDLPAKRSSHRKGKWPRHIVALETRAVRRTHITPIQQVTAKPPFMACTRRILVTGDEFRRDNCDSRLGSTNTSRVGHRSFFSGGSAGTCQTICCQHHEHRTVGIRRWPPGVERRGSGR